MTVRDLMTKRVATCEPDTNLAAATALMWDKNCGALPVLNDGGELVGVVTDRDICIALGTRNARASEVAVREVVANPPLWCKSTDHVRSALEVMRECRVRRLAALDDDGRLEGLVSLGDIIRRTLRSDGKAAFGYSSSELVIALQAIYARDSGTTIYSAAA